MPTLRPQTTTGRVLLQLAREAEYTQTAKLLETLKIRKKNKKRVQRAEAQVAQQQQLVHLQLDEEAFAAFAVRAFAAASNRRHSDNARQLDDIETAHAQQPNAQT